MNELLSSAFRRGRNGIRMARAGRTVRPLALLILASTAGTACAEWVPVDRPGSHRENYDVRLKPERASQRVRSRIGQKAASPKVLEELSQGRRALENAIPAARIVPDDVFGSPLKLSSRRGFLTSETKNLAPEGVVRNFVSQYGPAFGLRRDRFDEQVKTDASYQTPNNKQNWVRLKQEVGGIPVFAGELTALVTEKGQLTSLLNGMAPGLESKAVLANSVSLTPEDAAVVAAAEVGYELSADELVRTATGNDNEPVSFQNTAHLTTIRVEKVVFPLAPGEATIGWQVVLIADEGGHTAVIDAAEGSILFRKNLVSHQTQPATLQYYPGASPAPYAPYPFGPVSYPSTLPPQHDDPESPTSIAPPELVTTTTVSGLLPPEINRLGWIEDFSNLSSGNNVVAYRDQIPGDGIDTDTFEGLSYAYGHGDGPSQYNRNFLFGFFTPSPWGFSGPSQVPGGGGYYYDNGSVTNMFVWTNLYHDTMYRYGFTEAARNFQEQNFSRGGSQADAVRAEAQDWSGSSNANFLTPPDGFPGRMQMYRFADMSRDPKFGPRGRAFELAEIAAAERDSALDQQVLLHELTHGLTNRLIGNGSGLINQQGRGMGEGWSDFFSLSLLSDTNPDNDPDKVYPMGGWLTFDLGCRLHDNYFYGIRRFPYTTDLQINPLTFSHIDAFSFWDPYGNYYATPDRSLYPESPLCFGRQGSAPHNLGEIWSSILWQARSHVMRRFEACVDRSLLDPASATHAALQRGNEHMIQLVTDGLKLTPLTPTFVDARDAIMEAALSQTVNPPGFSSNDPVNPDIAALDEIALWRGFAARGLGFSADAPARSDGGVFHNLSVWYTVFHGEECPFPRFRGGRREDVKSISENSFVKFDLTGEFELYGRRYTKMFVSDNGFITFGDEDTPDTGRDGSPDQSLDHHFQEPRISVLLKDLDPTTGEIRIVENSLQNPSSVEVIWDHVQDQAGNENTFSVELNYRLVAGQPNPQSGTIRLNYGDMSTTDGVVGLSGHPFFPYSSSFFEEYDYSATGHCDMVATSAQLLTEEFLGNGDDFDLSNKSFLVEVNTTEAFGESPKEEFDVPLKIGAPILRKPGTEERLSSLQPGAEIAMSVPIGNEFVKANLSGAIGVLTPLDGNNGVTVVNPIATYGTIVSGGSSEGTPFLIQVADSSLALCGSVIQMRLDFTNDQQVTGSRVISMRVGEIADQETPYTFRFPQADQATSCTVSGNVPTALVGEETTILVGSNAALKTGVRLKNTSTGEVVEITQYSALVQPPQITVRRGINGVVEPMLAGQVLDFDSIPVPDASSFGLTTPITVSGVSGAFGGTDTTVGNVKVTIHEIRHARVGDLSARLTAPDGRVSVLLFDQLRNSSGQSAIGDLRNITFDDAAPVHIQSQGEPIPGQSYQPAGRQDSFSGLRAFRDAQVPANGVWKLTVSDGFAPLAGELVSWSISVGPKVASTCAASQTELESSLARGMDGWFGYTAGDPSAQSFSFNPGTPASLRLSTLPSPQPRVPAWQSPGADMTNIPNQVYRFSAWVYRSGQSNPNDQSQIPNMRIRAQSRFAMSNMAEYYFDPTQFDPQTNEPMLANAPSTDPARPTRYFVDFDPVDVPALHSGETPEQVKGTIENFSIYPNEHGSLEITEARIERYAAPSDNDGTLLRTYGPDDFAGTHYISRGNMANPDIFAAGPYPRPMAGVTSSGVTLDSRLVGNEGTSFATFDFVAADGNDPIVKPGKMYRVRFHLSSDTSAENNPQFRLRARTIKWSYANLFEVGSAKAAGEVNNRIAAEALPGVGTKNPNRRGTERTGGYYDLYFHPPAVMPADTNLRRLRFGFDLIDGVFGSPTPAQIGVSGRFTLDSIEVREFNAR